MNILKQITDNKRKEVAKIKALVSLGDLKQSPFFNRSCHSLRATLAKEGASGIIAEHKIASPSKGLINDSLEITEIIKGYVLAGASGISVLTDEKFFGGTIEDLAKARFSAGKTPLLRKDFIIDTYQIYESKAHGADVLLLIAACLTKEEVDQFSFQAHELGLEVLLELHCEEELSKVSEHVDMIGVNNRNLENFEVDIAASVKLAEKLPSNIMRISESGISSAETVRYLKAKGFKGFLMGENFMKEENPGRACQLFMEKVIQ